MASTLEYQKDEANAIEPNSNDILNGKRFANHVGNNKFLDACFSRTEEFKGADKDTRREISMSVVNLVRAHSGRFLEQRGDTWHELTTEEAVVKAYKRIRRFIAEENRNRKRLRDELCPELPDTIIKQLSGVKPDVCLLRLAKFFRAKSALLKKQAAKLDEWASGKAIGIDGILSLESILHRKNTLCYSKKVHELLLAVHEKMDTMEDGLPTWDMARNVKREMMK